MTPPIQKGEVAAPKTRSELEMLAARRGELQGQLRAAEERRAQLAIQSQMTGADQRGALTQRISALDERIQRLESQIERLDEAIAQGTANPAVVGEGEGRGADVAVPPVPGVPPIAFPEGPGAWASVPSEGPAGIHPEIIITGVGTSLVLMVLVSWITWRRAVAKFGRSARGLGESAEVKALQQSVDAIAIEVERISEGQRFLTKVLHERASVPELAGRAEPQPVSSRREL